MISEVVMPQMGADMTEGTLIKWLKNEGDAVDRGEIIAEIETDKANVEIEAFEGGVFRKALAGEGDVVQVGDVIALIAGAEDDISKYGNGATPAAQPRSSAQPAAAPTQPAEAPSSPTEQTKTDVPAAVTGGVKPAATAAPAADGRVRASPLAKRMAEERGIDLRTLKGTGPDGRIVKQDVELAGAGAPQHSQPRSTPTMSSDKAAPSATAAVTQVATPRDGDIVVTPTRMRQAIARRMSQSKREAPHYYLLVDADMTTAMEFREDINAELGDRAKVSINDLIVKACAIALQRHPVFNATIDGDAVTERAAQHVCIAIAMDDGLIAPAILDAGTKSLVEISLASRDLVDRAKNGALQAREVTDGTFTITNLGAYGIETLIGIIQPPQTAILGVGSVMNHAVARDGVVSARRIMKLALSADHRVTDGAQGAVFLGEIKRLLERPAALLL